MIAAAAWGALALLLTGAMGWCLVRMAALADEGDGS